MATSSAFTASLLSLCPPHSEPSCSHRTWWDPQLSHRARDHPMADQWLANS